MISLYLLNIHVIPSMSVSLASSGSEMSKEEDSTDTTRECECSTARLSGRSMPYRPDKVKHTLQ